jgi:hypothetical protein
MSDTMQCKENSVQSSPTTPQFQCNSTLTVFRHDSFTANAIDIRRIGVSVGINLLWKRDAAGAWLL